MTKQEFMPQQPILVVDDLETHLSLFTAALEEAGHPVLTARSQAEALYRIKTSKPILGLVDLVLPDGDGLELIQELKRIDPKIKLIAMTAFASVERAVRAIRHGAVDFVTKPLDPGRLISTVEAALSGPQLRDSHPTPQDIGFAFDGHWGSSEAMQAVHGLIRAVAGTSAPVFITGESGTGKVKTAQTIHNRSAFRDGPFVKLDCSTTSADCIEAELFGNAEIPGAIRNAQGGTLVLDEVCALPPDVQGRLLTTLRDHNLPPFESVTGTEPESPAEAAQGFRLICTSTPDPKAEMRAGNLRADLLFRLNVVPLHLPPLRSRKLDVIEIAEIELDRLCAKEGRDFRTLSTEVKAVFLDHDWPGNIRELLNVLWNIVILHQDQTVSIDNLPPYLRPHVATPLPKSPAITDIPPVIQMPAPPAADDPFAGRSLAEIERHAIEAAIEREGGSIPKAARVLDVSPSTIYRKLENWGISIRTSRKG